VSLGSISAAPSRRRWILVIVAVVVVAIGAGVAGYLAGGSGGTDLEAARAQGAEAGAAAGIQAGGRRGYALGYNWAEKLTFERHYPDAYRAGYAAAYDDAGLDVPKLAEIEVATP